MNPFGLPNTPFETTPVAGIHDTSQNQCLPKPETDISLAPCIRVNGKLMPNPDAGFCRTFRGYVSPNDTECPTICPDSCVEFWEYCPSGTGELTSVVHTKVPASAIIEQMKGNGLLGVNYKDYRECYAFGTKFCTYTETKLTRLNDGSYVCFKDCPPGTYQDEDMCYVSDPAVSGPPGAPLYCNPQYFSSVYANGTFIGCKKIPLGYKETETCPPQYEPIVNEQFTTEWCQHKCPSGFVPSMNLDFCFATCEGVADASPIQFHDYVEYYTTQGRCQGSPEGNCAANALGQCKPNVVLAVNTKYTQAYSNQAVLVPPGMPATVFATSSIPNSTRLGTPTQKVAQPDDPSTIVSCFPGMVTALPNTGEDTGFCYDECPDGFVSAEVCANTGNVYFSGVPPCDRENIRYVCIASCPPNWDPVVLDAKTQKVQTCAYHYPNNKVPTDPGLFVPCPTDGTFTSYALEDTTLPNGVPVPPRPPVCVRRIFERNEACPEKFYFMKEYITSSGAILPDRCIAFCPENSVPVFNDGIITCTEQCPQDGRFIQNFYTQATQSQILTDFKDSNCIRKSFGTGVGNDPLYLTTNQSDTFSDTRNTGLSVAAIVFGIFIILYAVKRFT
jgi:hypothetical protein